tara:strand:- start:767 stop:1996 length:1230 start_codon:yes stop_codon:yes gene_type:complete
MSYQILSEISSDLITEAESLKFVRESLLNKLEPPEQNASILRGARGIGKSTVVLQYLSKRQGEGKKVLYISADSTLLDQSLSQVALEFNKRGGDYLAIDEIHRYPKWQDDLKTIIDAFRKLKVIVSGSSAIELDAHGSDLSRRHQVISGLGLSFREYIQKNCDLVLPTISFHQLTTEYEEISFEVTKQFAEVKLDLLLQFKAYLRSGYFISRENYKTDAIYFASLINSINTIIDADLPSVHSEIDSLGRERIKQLLKSIAKKCPFTPNISELGRSLGIANDNTLKKYLFYLDQGEVLLNLYKKNRTHKDFPKPQKILFANTNYAFAYFSNPEVGTIREIFSAGVLKHLGDITSPDVGDILFNDDYLFEIGGRSKNHKQIKKIQNHFVLADDILIPEKQKIPLWMLGLLL